LEYKKTRNNNLRLQFGEMREEVMAGSYKKLPGFCHPKIHGTKPILHHRINRLYGRTTPIGFHC